jgi:hypothetical protein
MTTRFLSKPFALIAVLLIGAGAPVSITGQLLAYQDGFVFFTTGDGFKISPSIAILDDKTHQPAQQKPGPREYARAVFNDAGEVVELDLSQKPLPVEPLPDTVRQFAVVASSPYPNPELAPRGAMTTSNGVAQTFSGRPVLVTLTVQVPPDTPPSAQIFIATDASGWNPQAIQLDRVDALHFRVTRRFASGTILHYIYTRGSLQTEERGQNGLDVQPHQLLVADVDVRTVNNVVATWADYTTGSNQQIQPGVIPTPYNPAPFPNLPQGMPTPHAR